MNNRNTIIGLLLIFAIFIIFSYLAAPSKKDMEVQKQKNDSIENIKREQRAAAILEQAKAQVIREVQKKQQEKEGKPIDSVSLAKAVFNDQLGKFSGSGSAKNEFFTIENDFLRLKISNRGGKIEYVELKKFKTWDQQPLVLLDNDSLRFGFSFFSDNRIINTNNLYFRPHWYSTNNKNGNPTTVTGKDSIQFGMRLYVNGADSALNPDKYIEFIYTLHGN